MDHNPVAPKVSSKRRRIGALAMLAICAACTLMLGPTSVMSNENNSAPKEAASTMPAPRFGPRDRSDRSDRNDRADHDLTTQRPPPPQQMPPPPTTQERDDVIEFFRANMRSRMAFFDQLPDGRPAKNRMLQMMTERYRRLQRVKAEDPVVYELMVSQMSLQDEAISLLREQQRAIREEDQAKKDEYEQKLRDKVKQLVDVSLQERRKRVERLEKMLQDQKSRLEQDEANPEGLVDQHLKQMKADADEMRKAWPRRGGGGGFGPERRPPATTSSDATPTDSRR